MEPSGIPSDRLVRHVKPTTYTAGWLKRECLVHLLLSAGLTLVRHH